MFRQGLWFSNLEQLQRIIIPAFLNMIIHHGYAHTSRRDPWFYTFGAPTIYMARGRELALQLNEFSPYGQSFMVLHTLMEDWTRFWY